MSLTRIVNLLMTNSISLTQRKYKANCQSSYIWGFYGYCRIMDSRLVKQYTRFYPRELFGPQKRIHCETRLFKSVLNSRFVET